MNEEEKIKNKSADGETKNTESIDNDVFTTGWCLTNQVYCVSFGADTDR